MSSVVYNMAGDVNKRPNFLKTAVLGGVIAKNGLTIGETIQKSYLGGPGIKLRSFGRWARTSGYNATIGQDSSYISLGNSISYGTIMPYLPVGSGQYAQIQSAEIGTADYSYWADRYMADNHPELLMGSWSTNFNETAGTIEVSFNSGGSTVYETFTPAGFSPGKKYLYVRYNAVEDAIAGPVVIGSTVSLGSGAFPAHATGAVSTYYTNTVIPVTLTTTVQTDTSYTDATPFTSVTTSSSTSSSTSNMAGGWEHTVFMGDYAPGVDQKYSIKYTQHESQVQYVASNFTTNTTTETLSGGVIKTTTVYTNTQYVFTDRSYRIDQQNIFGKKWSNVKVFIYENNSGNSVLDTMFNVPGTGGTFLPFIPLRLNNVFITPGDLQDAVKKALRRGLNTTFDTLKDKIEDNPSIGDIDYAYVVYGVSFNVKENACRRYLYEFFQEIMLGKDLSGSDYQNWQNNWEAARQSWATWKTWKTAQTDTLNVLFDTPEPTRIPYPEPPYYDVSVTSGGRGGIDYNMLISWHGIRETVTSSTAHKAGEVWIENLGQTTYDYDVYTDGEVASVANGMDRIKINWQEDSDTVRSLEIWGLNHFNTIYGGKGVNITAGEALSDSEESGFIIPLHENIYRDMRLIDATQMSTACVFMVFNCYTIVKSPWYASSWFKILLVVAVIIITVVTAGSGAGSIGLLGAAAEVGGALGFTGTAAVIAGTIANAIAAMIVVQIITAGSKAIFGEKVGAIVGIVASVIAISAGTSYMNGGSFTVDFTDLLKPDNLLKLTESAGKGYTDYINAETRETVLENNTLLEATQKQLTEISKMTEELFGNDGHGVLNPMSLTEIGQSVMAETRDTFLTRTLLTGSDIASISTETLTNFAELTISTKLPI